MKRHPCRTYPAPRPGGEVEQGADRQAGHARAAGAAGETRSASRRPRSRRLCKELLDARPRGHAPVRRHKQAGEPRRLVTRGKAFEMNGVSLRIGSGVAAAYEQTVPCSSDARRGCTEGGGREQLLLWAPNIADSRPWSDSPGGRTAGALPHRRSARRSGRVADLTASARRVRRRRTNCQGGPRRRRDRLNLRVEKARHEYWASWTPAEKRVVVNSFE